MDKEKLRKIRDQEIGLEYMPGAFGYAREMAGEILKLQEEFNRLRRAVKLYLKVDEKMRWFVSCRRQHAGMHLAWRTGIEGIRCADDEYAKRWQGYEMRREWLLAYISGRIPNWHYAKWLTVDEAQARNYLELKKIGALRKSDYLSNEVK